MLQTEYSFEELKLSSQLVRDFIQEDEKIMPLVNNFFDLDNIKSQIQQKSFDLPKRTILVNSLREQNKGIDCSNSTQKNIESLLDENTFTITTGHQLNLLGGPLYFIYKIAQCIEITEGLNQEYSNHHFVPVFWMATEDHDFDEINHIHLFGQKIEWNKENQENVIAGRINTASITAFLEQIEGKFQDPSALEVIQKFTAIYKTTNNLAEASRKLVNSLFGEMGIVVLDGDDATLKACFKDIMSKEMREDVAYKSVMKTNDYLEKNNYHQQVFVRHSNLFYINENGVRQRIKKENGEIFIADEKRELASVLQEIMDYPERFSPNALYRPLYQESILPNLAYIGGGGEVAYWLQIKGVFEAHGLTYPMIRVRDSILLYDQRQAEMLDRLELDLMDLKLGIDQIVADIAKNNSDEDIDLKEAEGHLVEAKSAVMEKVQSLNPGLGGMVEAEFVKMHKTIEKIESKLMKAEKSKHEQVQKKLTRVRDQFFPNNGFQERHDNFLPYYLKDEQFVSKILSNLKSANQPLIRTIEV
jgi:bacillithiol synthase